MKCSRCGETAPARPCRLCPACITETLDESLIAQGLPLVPSPALMERVARLLAPPPGVKREKVA